MPSSLPSSFEIPFASLLVYSPRGESEVSKQSRHFVRDGVKYDRPGILEKAVFRLLEVVRSKENVATYFAADVTLVPIPRSSPIKGNSLWVPMRICEELRKEGLGHSIVPGLVRTHSIQKSAFAKPGERPQPNDHLESLAWQGPPPPTGKVLLVDDFVTRGSAIMGSAAAVLARFTDVDIAAFGLVRTMGQVKDVTSLLDPCTGRITLHEGSLNRRP